MKEKIIRILPIAGLLGLMFFVFWPILSGGVLIDTGVVYSDLWLFNYPLKDWYREMLLNGKLPFWTSLVGNGFPVFAEFQVGALYPFHLVLYRFFPTHVAFNLNIFIHFSMAAVFTYLFSRVSLGISKAGSVLAGMAYSLCAFFLLHTHQINILLVICYLPLVFLAVERLVKTKRWIWVFVMGVIFALQILAGYVEMFYYTVLLGFVFILCLVFFFPEKSLKEKKSSYWLVLGFMAAVIMGIGISAAQILPTWELIKYTQRSEGVGFEQASATRWPVDTLYFFVNPGAYENYQTDKEYHPMIGEFVDVRGVQGYLGLLPLLLAFLFQGILFYYLPGP